MRRLRAALLALTLSAVPLLSVLSPAPVAGQESHAVRGVVADSTGAGMGGAMVVALILPDTVLKEYTLSGGDGRFTLPRLSPGEYLLQVTMVGHRTLRQPFTVAAADLDAGTLRMEVLAVQLDPLVVSVDHVPFVNRGDTLDFNANAFTTRPNASVEELLARLPGIEVDEDGTIRAQGEEVRNVLVDGREFFGTDPTIATEPPGLMRCERSRSTAGNRIWRSSPDRRMAKEEAHHQTCSSARTHPLRLLRPAVGRDRGGPPSRRR